MLSPSHNTSTGPMSFLGRYPNDGSQVPSWGVPQSQVGVPQDRVPPGQDSGSPPGQVRIGYPWPGLGYPPPARTGVPPPQPGQHGVPPSPDRTVDRPLAPVCLLRSRRRTVMLKSLNSVKVNNEHV